MAFMTLQKLLRASGMALIAGIGGWSALVAPSAAPAMPALGQEEAAILLPSSQLRQPDAPPGSRALRLDGLFYETADGRVALPAALTSSLGAPSAGSRTGTATMPDGRTVRLTVNAQGADFVVSFGAEPAEGIVRWGLAVDARPDEYFTGILERVVDGPQAASWRPGIEEAMNLRGQRVELIIKPTTSVYAPFYLSSRGYGLLIRSDWPGELDFAAADPARVAIAVEGPSLELKLYTSSDPAAIVRAHAMEAGPPFLPPAWLYTPWRWRDEHRQREAYYDGTPVAGPFNAEVMEDVMMMQAFGIPNGIYWIDRPWGPGQPWGYDDFEIDGNRLPNFAAMVRWLESKDMKTVLWIAPFFQGRMAEEALAKGWNLAGQARPANGNNYPMVDMSNPAARAYWQEGVAKLLRLGVAGFKLDRGEENIPNDGPYRIFDGRTIRENRNAYVAMYIKAVHDVAREHRGDDFFLMPRAAYTGASPYAVFWGGDIGGTQEGLRASIVAMQRSAVMGYPNWGSDICGYNQQLMEQEVCGRWLAFGAFSPIMEVGPTRNVGFWNLPREPQYDHVLIALWRLYARVHQRLADYSYRHAQEATKTGLPIVRPLLLVDPEAREAWSNWWTYLYGRDLLVSPVWRKGQREQQVYLPRGDRWRDAWRPGTVHEGGQTVTVAADLHQIPLFVREGSNVTLGNLEAEWRESLAIAQRRPDLAALEKEIIAWFGVNGQGLR
jgi:alpha-glucosidase (family GH31 glycosyl hydrolase)